MTTEGKEDLIGGALALAGFALLLAVILIG